MQEDAVDELDEKAVLKELLDLEEAGWASLCDGTGDRFYGEAMTPDGLMVLANGAVMTRLEVIEALAEAPPWDRFSIDDPTTIDLGGEATALVYTGTARRDDVEFVGVMTSVYVRPRGEWKLALYQQTTRS
jgi:hypothetical protein